MIETDKKGKSMLTQETQELAKAFNISLEQKPDFDGETYVAAFDKERLGKQLRKVFDVMIDGQWRSLDAIVKLTGGSATSISARIRDLRKEKFGGFTIENRRIGDKESGYFEYRMLTTGGKL